MAITDLARREIADTEQQQELTTEKESDSRLQKVTSSDSSDPVHDEVECFFKQEQSPRDSFPLTGKKLMGHISFVSKTGNRVTSTPAEHEFSLQLDLLCLA